jgi:hypothetical protein
MSTPEDAAVIEAAVAALTPNAPETQTPTTPTAGAPAAVPHCENCGAGVPGRYCGNCGQRLDPPLHSLRHFLAIALEDVTHADSRLWRTLAALLFRPGFLTHEFLAGRRARYLPPVRLYLVLSVAFFLWAAAVHTGPRVLQFSTDENGLPKSARVLPLNESTSIAGASVRPGETLAERNQRECAMINYQGLWQATLGPRIQKACLKIRGDDARSLDEAYIHNLPRALFLFLPLLAAAMMLMYWWPRHYYVEHLLLLVHNHACVFLIVPLAWVLRTVAPFASPGVNFALVLYIPWYTYRSMRTVYGQGGWLTFAKLMGLGFFYVLFGMLMFVVNFAYSALTLPE